MKNKLGKQIIPICKIHMVKEEALGEGPKGGAEKKNQKSESEAQSIS